MSMSTRDTTVTGKSSTMPIFQNEHGQRCRISPRPSRLNSQTLRQALNLHLPPRSTTSTTTWNRLSPTLHYPTPVSHLSRSQSTPLFPSSRSYPYSRSKTRSHAHARIHTHAHSPRNS
nr:hypothetical protein I308_03723 [Cryptococcus tetragattii IND107]